MTSVIDSAFARYAVNGHLPSRDAYHRAARSAGYVVAADTAGDDAAMDRAAFAAALGAEQRLQDVPSDGVFEALLGVSGGEPTVSASALREVLRAARITADDAAIDALVAWACDGGDGADAIEVAARLTAPLDAAERTRRLDARRAQAAAIADANKHVGAKASAVGDAPAAKGLRDEDAAIVDTAHEAERCCGADAAPATTADGSDADTSIQFTEETTLQPVATSTLATPATTNPAATGEDVTTVQERPSRTGTAPAPPVRAGEHSGFAGGSSAHADKPQKDKGGCCVVS